MSKGVVIHESTINAVIEQLGYWADYCDDSEGYLEELMKELEEASNNEDSRTIGLFDKLPEPTSTEDVVIQGTGSFQKVWKASDVTPRGKLDKVFAWKLVGIS
ncbi:hypothetical protein KNV09_gp177 [Vibrio phage Athena]|uniref:Uncharacterized protein n=5 Tax=Thalassavirus TaxID=2948922 RepID=A0A6M9Z2B5_9CAUD|nr:hypothetical protein KNU88_gp175 [Vibrio phage Chester]YP_010108155.1 hypothetical protein KNV06_gp174 [Vibrio phage AG74]YP_010108345.1 hypothetical protein KNV07_gp177 [Vibrio phage Cody]YP_010108539.1 hypothetical protein KNV08_gp181 [Vibrio phage Quinn]YP_010108733.1 hypothetical protein KNV09_gp177 [Vibrio phage Athena]QIG66232.1 hypothetical protein CILSICK_129 [Vibrio phage Cilsick]WCD55803.1 hypothetical protein ROCKET24_126 [Vibrio phage Rocket24]QIN96538.1 hypothetical protein C